MVGCADDRLTVVTGNNRWVVARTDRDAPTQSDVLETAGAFLSRVLGDASPTGQRTIFEHIGVPAQPAGQARYVIGAARPVIVTAAQPRTPAGAIEFSRPQGRLLGRREDCPVIRSVQAQDPWLVTVDFDWRAPTTTIPWPRRAVNALGFPVDTDTGLDWLLLAATHVGPAQRDDTTLLSEVSESTRREIRKATRLLSPALLAIGIGGAAYLIHRYAPKRRKRSAA